VVCGCGGGDEKRGGGLAGEKRKKVYNFLPFLVEEKKLFAGAEKDLLS